MTNQEIELDRKVKNLILAVRAIEQAIESHEFDYARMKAIELERELEYANHLANKLAEEE